MHRRKSVTYCLSTYKTLGQQLSRNEANMKERSLKNPSPYVCNWRVPRAGFKWITASASGKPPKRFLVENFLPPYRAYEAQAYDPIRSCTALFRNFAALEVSEESFLRFANEYGALGISNHNWLRVDWAELQVVPGASHSPDNPILNSGTFGESFSDWVDEVLWMRGLIFLWDSINRADLAGLGKVIAYEAEDAICYRTALSPYDNQPYTFWLADVTAISHAAQSRNHIEVAAAILHQQISRRISAQARLAQSGTSILVEASTLTSALWLQFAFAVTGHHIYRTCPICANYFQVGPKAEMRSDSVFCSNACRQAQYRRKAASVSSKKKRGEDLERL